jgi:hypothetical protein
MDFLSKEQRERFENTNKLFGLGPQEFTAHLSDEEHNALPQTRLMSSTGDSHFPRHYASVGSIAEMRRLAGFGERVSPNPLVREPPYPEPLPKAVVDSVLSGLNSSLKPQLTQEIADKITAAAAAYVIGDPARVESYVPLINALKFPGRAAVFTGETLTVPDGAVHVIDGDDPVVMNYGRIVVGKNATIRFRAASYLQCQIFTQAPGVAATAGLRDAAPALDAIAEVGDAPSPTIFDFSGAPWTDPAQQGAQGDTGPVQTGASTNGASHYDGGSCVWVCDTQPRNGLQGNAGGTGKTGTPGAPGHPSPAGVHRLGVLTQAVTVIIGGGDGQKGGKGGRGGDGGPGGQPGSTANGCNNSVGVGPQGPGGKGGEGGPGGPGGDSGFVKIYYTWSGPGDGVTVQVRSVSGGKGGEPGDPGTGPSNLGPGGPGGTGKQGATPQFSLNRE